MKFNLGVATVIAIGSGAAGVVALDLVPNMVGAFAALSTRVVNVGCPVPPGAIAFIPGNPTNYDGTGTVAGENALKVIAGGTQMIAPMARAMGSSVCAGPTPAQRAGAEGLVFGLQAATIVVNPTTAGVDGIDYPGMAGDPANQWRTVLRLLYTGMDISAGNNVFLRDCNSAARSNIVNNWDNVFHGTVTSCTDSHPSVAGPGPTGYDPSNAIVEPGVRHAFRRDDMSGITDVFLSQLSLASLDFAQAAPSGSNTIQTAVYRALANSPFCNVKRPDDEWPPVTLAANATLGFNASQIPEVTSVGVPAGAGTGLGFVPFLKGSSNATNLSPYLTEYMDEDPIRRKCVGRGNNANAAFPFEQVCAADGTLGVVLPITIPANLDAPQLYPSLPCEPNRGFFLGPSLTRPTTDPVRCPNGDVTQDGQCLLPVRTDSSQPNGVAFDCINPPGNVPQAVFDTDGDGSQFPDAPGTDGRTDVDGRVYNLILRKPSGEIRTVSRQNPSRVGLIQTPVAAAYYRIHTTRSLLVPPPNHTTNTCTRTQASDQIGCLTLASPCSIGVGTLESLTNNAAAALTPVNGIADSQATIQNLVRNGARFPLARKAFLNSLQGFDVLFPSDPVTFPPLDSEEEMTRCYSALPPPTLTQFELVSLPASLPGGTIKPLCIDFNGQAVCGDATNTDACVGNESIHGGGLPTSACNNGLIDGDEIGPDICPPARPTCNPLTSHCQFP